MVNCFGPSGDLVRRHHRGRHDHRDRHGLHRVRRDDDDHVLRLRHLDGHRVLRGHTDMVNAVAFSPEGGAIRVDVRRGRKELEIVIRNEGEGVDPADLPRLMLPFEQGENALTRQGQGAGLGLAICDLACRAMGGRLELASQRGCGFSAHVVLPVR